MSSPHTTLILSVHEEEYWGDESAFIFADYVRTSRTTGTRRSRSTPKRLSVKLANRQSGPSPVCVTVQSG